MVLFQHVEHRIGRTENSHMHLLVMEKSAFPHDRQRHRAFTLVEALDQLLDEAIRISNTAPQLHCALV